MKKIALSLALLMLVITGVFSQTATEKKTDASTWGIKLSGFVRNDAFYDSRQVVSARPAAQGELLLYPSPVVKDPNGTDINAAPSFSILAITSRLTGTITGPDAFGAKTSGVIEAEFFGNANGNENSFRLRHAYAKLDWAKTQLGFGQYWHPLFVTDCFPGTISFNTGIPFQPFARNPQIRLTQKLGKEVNLILAAVSQIEAFTSPGSSTGVALGASSAASTYAVNAVVPNLHAQLQYKAAHLLLGAALDYKELRPALKATSGTSSVSTNEHVKSLSFEAYGKLTTRDVIVKAEYVAGQNLYEQLIAADGVQHVLIEGGSYFFKPNRVIVKVNVPVELSVSVEKGLIPHTLVIQAPEAGISVDEKLSSDAKLIRFTPTAAGKYPFYCRNKLLFFKSHREKGMEGVLEVVQ